MPKVSIIVPNYNHASYLEERLESIFNQTFQDFEVILLDDASTDNSLEVLGRYANKEQVSHFVINKENSGSPFKQWRKGLELAMGEYVWIAESDDFCSLNFLETQVSCLGEADVSAAKVLLWEKKLIKDTKIVTHNLFGGKEKRRLKSTDFSYRCPLFNVSSLLFVNPMITKADKINFDTYQIIGDMVFYLEFFEGKVIAYNNKATSYYRIHSSNVSNTRLKSLNYYNRFFKEHIEFANLLDRYGGWTEYNNRHSYLRRRFFKIKNCLTADQKLSLLYMKIWVHYLLSINNLTFRI